MKKEAAADGPVEPPAGVPGAGVTSAVVQTPPRPHAFDTPSEVKVGGPSRTVSATATAATAASAWGEEGAHVRPRPVLQRLPGTPQRAQHAPGGPTRGGPCHRSAAHAGRRTQTPPLRGDQTFQPLL